MVCHRATQDRLGQRVDQPLTTTNHLKSTRRCQGTICRQKSRAPTCQNMKRKNRNDGPTNSPPVQTICEGLQRGRVKETTPQTTVGPCHRPKRGSSFHAHQPKHPTIPAGTGRTQKVPQRAPRTRDDLTIKEPLCCRLLLHKKEKQKATTSTRL